MNEIFVTVLCLLSFSGGVTGGYRAICPTPLVEKEEGDDVTLQCHLDPPIDLTDHTLDWGRDDSKETVYAYRDKKPYDDEQAKRYRNRTTINLEGLTRGEMALRISSAQQDDSGPYRCCVPDLKVNRTVNVTVVPKGQLNTSKIVGDVSTTRPPGTHVTNPKDGENTICIPMSVFLLPVVLCIIVGVVALFECGIICMIVKMRGKKAEQEWNCKKQKCDEDLNRSCCGV